MDFNNMKQLLTESNGMMMKQGVNPNTQFTDVLTEQTYFDMYVRSLAEGLDPVQTNEFVSISGLIRESLLTETVYGGSPHSKMVLPIFRKFWQNNVAREACTVIPMDQPEVRYAFMVARAVLSNGTTIDLPNYAQGAPNITGPTMLGITAPFTVNVPSNTDVIAGNGFDPATSHLSKDFVMTEISFLDSTGATQTKKINVQVDEKGYFVYLADCDQAEDTISGYIDFKGGSLSISNTRSGSANSKVISVSFVGSITQAEEGVANKITLSHEWIMLHAQDHDISAEWSIQHEQDIKAYFDIDIQASFVDTFGNLIGQEIDSKIINQMIMTANLSHPAACQTFSKQPMAGWQFGKRQWANEIVMDMNKISDQIHVDTMIAGANTIIANPQDVGYIKSGGDHAFKGNSMGGEIGSTPVAGTFNESWKVLSTVVMPKGKMLMILKPTNPEHAVYVFSPYRPLTLSPWPMGKKPTMTFLSRYGAQFIRKEGVGLLTITD